MLLIEQVRTKLTGVLEKHEEDKSTVIAVVPLSPEDAIGDQVSDDFPIKVGKSGLSKPATEKQEGRRLPTLLQNGRGLYRNSSISIFQTHEDVRCLLPL